MAPFTLTTTADEAATDFAASIRGRTILITGISPNSLGAVAAKSIAKHQPKLLIFASRTLANINKVAEEIKAEGPDVDIRALELDLASQQSARVAAEEVLSYPENIDVYIHNASIMAVDYALTPEGVESQFGINYLGHFLFTCLIMPKIIAAGAGSRIVIVSSRGHQYSDIRWNDVNFNEGKDYDRFAAYGQSKTANALFAVALGERLSGKGITAFSVHPGVIPDTNLGRGIPTAALEALGIKVVTDSTGKRSLVTHNPDGTPLRTPDGALMFKTLEAGGATLVRTAFDPSIASSSGRYLAQALLPEETSEFELPAPHAQDKEAAEKLWALSEKLVGQEFNI